MMFAILKDFLLQLTLIASMIFTYQLFTAWRFEQKKRADFILVVLTGVAILLCMTFPAYVNAHIRMDIRIVPLLLGTLYGGWRTGVFLSAVIIVYRYYLGSEIGFYTTVVALLCGMPVFISLQKRFLASAKKKKLQIAFLLTVYYSFAGLAIVSVALGLSLNVLRVQAVYTVIILAIMLFFVALNETIHEMLSKIQRMQLDAKEAEIAFLRSQIKPHFLYNALSSIAALCIDEPRKAGELTIDLSQYLRSSFDFKQLDSLTSLENEIELVQAYLNIEKARFGARLHAEFDVDADLDLKMRIPPLILQPLVENAIRHGLMPSLRGGTVRVAVKREADGMISFAVADDGCGLSESRRQAVLQPDADTRGIGLWNISQRIRLLYGTALRIDSKEGFGTKVMFAIPALPAQGRGG